MENQTRNLKTWCSVSLDNIAHNYRYVKSKTKARVIAVVKAGAYGHGAVPVAKRLEKEGCDFFAVSSIEEALELRCGGIKQNILILGYILPMHIGEAVENDIAFACASSDFAGLLLQIKTRKKMKIHLKINTGMNRTGFVINSEQGAKDFEKTLEAIKSNDNIEVEGIFSHLAKAENDEEFSAYQYERFMFACDLAKKHGIDAPIRHICNSAGAENYPSMHHDAVRVGIHLYGCESREEGYKPTIEFCTRVVDIHTIEKGEGVSYGLCYVADEKRKIAVIGAGYADGIFRCLSYGKGCVYVGGKKCKIIGRVCMDMTMIDITDVPEVKVGDEVVIWGRGVTCEMQAKSAGTISYELMCSLSPRVARVYDNINK